VRNGEPAVEVSAPVVASIDRTAITGLFGKKGSVLVTPAAYRYSPAPSLTKPLTDAPGDIDANVKG
jgi:hypothetical protein